MPNHSTVLIVKTSPVNAGAVYWSYRKDVNGADYEVFRDRSEVKGHADLDIILDVVDQLMKPKRLISLPGEIPSFRGFNPGFFRDETPKRDLPKKMRHTNNLVAIPGKNRDTGLRLLCLQYDYKTIVLMDGYDKMGHKGSFQSNPRLKAIADPLLRLFEAVFDALDWQDYSVNTVNIGFVKRGEAVRCDAVDLDPYCT